MQQAEKTARTQLGNELNMPLIVLNLQVIG